MKLNTEIIISWPILILMVNLFSKLTVKFFHLVEIGGLVYADWMESPDIQA